MYQSSTGSTPTLLTLQEKQTLDVHAEPSHCKQSRVSNLLKYINCEQTLR